MNVRPWILCVLPLVVGSGCEPDRAGAARPEAEADAPDRTAEIERRFAETTWDTLWVRGGADEAELLNPGRMRAWGEGVVLYDSGDGAVKRLDSRGRIAWRWGGRGQGPEELSRVRDLVVGPDDQVHLLDQGNGRIVVLDDTGRRVRSVPLAGVPYADRFVPLGEERWLLVTADASPPLLVVGREGRVLSRHPFPWEPFAEMSILVKQGNVALGPDGWSYLFSPGDGWFALREAERISGRRPFVEHTPFPRVEERVVGNRRETRVIGGDRCSACSASLVDSTLWVHFGGAGEDRFRVLDRYDWEGGEYLGSLRLPARVHEVAVGRDRVHTLRADPYPEVVGLRPGVFQ